MCIRSIQLVIESGVCVVLLSSVCKPFFLAALFRRYLSSHVSAIEFPRIVSQILMICFRTLVAWASVSISTDRSVQKNCTSLLLAMELIMVSLRLS